MDPLALVKKRGYELLMRDVMMGLEKRLKDR